MKKLTTAEFIDRFYARHPDGLGLDLSKFVYTTSRTYSTTFCKIHSKEINNTANNLMQGIKRCKECMSDAISNAQSYDLQTFIDKSKKIHGDTYDYSRSIWTNSRTKLCIICKTHGPFMQNPQLHWNGYGCSKCGYTKLRKTKEEFIAEANKNHNNKYLYDNVDYINNYTPVQIVCKEHGPFYRSPRDHVIYQRGCPVCYPGNRSWREIAWLNDLGVPNDCRQKYINLNGSRIIVDAKVKNTVYEFWGDFWHGNPDKFNHEDKNTKCNKTFGELYNNTMNKRKLILEAGYDLVEIWESDYLNKGK